MPRWRKHGHAVGKGTRTYQAWKNAHNRCRPSYPFPQYYFEKGITVCKRWKIFTNFLADMGECPPGMTLERKRNSKGYSKSNCIWATPLQQAANISLRKDAIFYRGKRVKDWAIIWGTTYRAAHKRIVRRLAREERTGVVV